MSGSQPLAPDDETIMEWESGKEKTLVKKREKKQTMEGEERKGKEK